MTLSDRLAAAAMARGDQPAPPPAHDLLPPPVEPSVQIQVLAQPGLAVTTVTPDPAAPIETVCPTCGREGKPDLIDIPGGSVHWACATCQTLWTSPITPASGYEPTPTDVLFVQNRHAVLP